MPGAGIHLFNLLEKNLFAPDYSVHCHALQAFGMAPSTVFTKEFDMTPSKTIDGTQPASEGSPTQGNKPLPASPLHDNPQDHPDQAGAGYGGYGHADNSFGRDPGSSSEEGGQGGTVPESDNDDDSKSLQNGSDGGRKTRHAPSTDISPDDSAGMK